MRMLIDKRVEKLNYNKKYFKLWKKVTNKTGGSYKQYQSAVIKFIEYFESQKKDITQIKDEDAKKYIREVKKGKVGDVFRSSLIEFFTIIKKEFAISIDINFLVKLKVKEVERKAKVLSVEDIIAIRNKLASKNTYYSFLLAFEMFYIHGITLGAIEQFGKNNYSQVENLFKFKSKGKQREIKLSTVITNLLNKHPNLLESKGRTSYSNYMQDISSIVKFKDRDKIIWGDIEETRKEYFPTCSNPKCKQKYPNSAEFWALIEFEDDVHKTHWIYCKDCAFEMRDKE